MNEKVSKVVFMIAYQFPPMGGSGVQRTSKFAKYLRNFGWEPIIFTVQAPKGLQDNSLLNDLKLDDLKNINVIRTKSYNLGDWKKPFNILGKIISRKFFIPDAEWLWYKKNKKRALECVEKYKPDVIYSTSYPYSDHLIGYYIKKKYPNIPWVVDFRDEWTNNPYILDMNYSRFRMNIERSMEKRVVENCNYFITNSPYMLEGFKKDYNLDNISYVIPNGFDKSDFEDIVLNNKDKNKLVITYTGSMYGRRKPDTFLLALKQAINSGKLDKDKISVQFVGNFSSKSKDKVNTILGFENIVTFYPYMEHKKSIEFLMNSDVLLLIVGAGKGARNFYTGKIFEYINTKKTILGLIPEDGAAAEVIKETKTGYVVDSRNVDKICENIIEIYKKWENNRLIINTDYEEVNKYDRIVLTKRVSEIFDRCLT